MRLNLTRILFIVLGVAIVAALVYAFRPRPVEVETAEVVRGRLVVTVDEDGRTRIRERYVVSAPLAGELQRVNLRAGDAVVAGETTVATVLPTDPALLDPRALAESEARVRRAEAVLRQAEPVLERARAQLDFAEDELTRVRTAHERGAATRSELDAAMLRDRIAREEYNAARFSEEIARFELEIAEAALLRTRPHVQGASAPGDSAVQFMRIPSPITGRVLRVMQESAAVVGPGTPLLEIGDPRDLEIVIDVLSTEAVQIRPGAHVFIEHWGGEETLSGAVRLIEPQGFTRISALGVEEQRVNVIVDFTDPPGAHEASGWLGDAYRVEARIVVWEGVDVLKVPTAAMFRHSGEWAVFVVEDGRAALRAITIGRRTATQAQVIDRLAEGDRVIVHPADVIAHGTRVAE